ncbi:diaminopimelate decarboxylase [bacterium]|nr:diaminopimelate decarboxylase [bacterium]
MIPFHYRHQQLYCEEVALTQIAERCGTPLYVYSLSGVLENYRRMDDAFTGQPHRICYALKANANPELLRQLASLGAGADVVSGGELKQALRAGFPPDKIAFAGVGKTDDEIRLALQHQILALNVESRQELQVIASIAEQMQVQAPIAVRINPDIDIEGHPYLTTGKSANKFGISLAEARDAYLWAASCKSLRLVGVHCHIGSMIKKADPYRKMAETLAAFVADMKDQGIHLEHIDLGGGIGVDYSHVLAEHGSPFYIEPADLAQTLLPVLKATGCELIFEPGRALVGPNGVLLALVLYTKQTAGKTFVVVDTGMNDLIRPSLYGAHHEILPLQQKTAAVEAADVVGPICESGDFLAKDRLLPAMKRGERLAVMTAGAYGYVLSSQYNLRPRAAEVMVQGDGWQVVRERESL